ncbi:MAG: PAS domain-containing protein [Cryomorphaceae bacterium]|jgi:PAS domain S-box-containing protein|nr:PAS domain-containing protein [Cryomorphaceae bacterium]
MQIIDDINIRVISGTRIGIWDWNVQTGETLFNERWAEIIGYTLEELQPISIETWMKHAHPEDLEWSNKLLNSHFSGETSYYDCQARMRHKDGHWVWVHDRGKVFEWDKEGRPLRMCGSHIDITEQKEQELNLKKALEEKEVLLSEVHHRVKNNLQLVKSIARLKQVNGHIAISEVEESINAIASAHEAVYRSADFEHIDVRDYIQKIVSSILIGQNIKFQLHAAPISLDINRLIPVGLIVMECVGNSIKHAFQDVRTAENMLKIEINETEQSVRINVRDNGVGFHPSVLNQKNRESGFGIQILRSLTDQLEGEIEFLNDGGACVELKIPIN